MASLCQQLSFFSSFPPPPPWSAGPCVLQIDNGQEPIRLTTQYRMDPAIQQFPSAHFYRGRLVPAEDVLARPPLDLLPSIPGPYVVVDVPEGVERTPVDSTSYTNDEELAAVVAIVKTLRALRMPSTSIGIVTFYSAMKLAIMQALASDVEHGLAVNTVDGFQVGGLQCTAHQSTPQHKCTCTVP